MEVETASALLVSQLITCLTPQEVAVCLKNLLGQLVQPFIMIRNVPLVCAKQLAAKLTLGKIPDVLPVTPAEIVRPAYPHISSLMVLGPRAS